MAISRFQSQFKARTDLMDNITPNNVVQMNASVPAGEWKPANWLPVVWQNEKSKDYFTISSGKVVSFDASGRVVPSGLIRQAEATAHDAAFLIYTLADKDARVVDLVTGDFVAAAESYTLKEFCDAGIDNGWMPGVTVDASDSSCRDFVRQFISAPVGVAAYDVYVWAGDDPANLHFTNYQKQHLIQFFSDVQMRVAHVCEEEATELTLLANGAATPGTEVSADDTEVASALVRYKHLINAADVLVMPLLLGKVASSTSRTPVSFEGWVGRERSSIELLSRDGDWYLDADAGNLLFFKAAAAATELPVGSDAGAMQAGDKVKVYDYTDAASDHSKMMHLVGDARPGDFVTFDAHSNFMVRNSKIAIPDLADAGHDGDEVEAQLAILLREEEYTVGRVYELQKEPRGLLERVKTGWKGSEFGADAKMPGSATKGFSDLITLSPMADDRIADEIAIVNVKIK
jgi:hypothetical protein